MYNDYEGPIEFNYLLIGIGFITLVIGLVFLFSKKYK